MITVAATQWPFFERSTIHQPARFRAAWSGNGSLYEIGQMLKIAPLGGKPRSFRVTRSDEPGSLVSVVLT